MLHILVSSIHGLVSALSCALQFYFMRKRQKKLRINKLEIDGNKCLVHASAGISDSCITKRSLLNENTQDTRYLLSI